MDPSPPPPSPPPSSTLLFASCNQPHIPPSPEILSLWSSMRSKNPAGFVWGGDAVYGDRVSHSLSYAEGFTTDRSCADYDRLIGMYDKVLNEPFYPLSPSTYHFGTIDDHDLGCNNAGKWFEMARRKEDGAGAAFVGHFVESSNEEWYERRGEVYDRESDSVYRRSVGRDDSQLPGRGVYGVKVFEFPEAEGESEPVVHHEVAGNGTFPGLGVGNEERKVAVFVVDCRTNKDVSSTVPFYFLSFSLPFSPFLSLCIPLPLSLSLSLFLSPRPPTSFSLQSPFSSPFLIFPSTPVVFRPGLQAST